MYATMKYLGDDNDIDRLDQTIITAMLDKYCPYMKIFFVGEDIIHSEYMKWFGHNSDNEIGYSPSHVLTPHFSNKEVTIFSM